MIDSLYHWVRALHIIAVISWMAGMLYLPRLYVYHSQVDVKSQASELFKIMERRLLRIIINPAMIIAWGAGVWMAFYINAFDPVNGSWFHAKLTLLILMQISHAMLARWRRAFSHDKRPKSERFFRIFNEVPTVLMILIVVLVVVKPI